MCHQHRYATHFIVATYNYNLAYFSIDVFDWSWVDWNFCEPQIETTLRILFFFRFHLYFEKK